MASLYGRAISPTLDLVGYAPCPMRYLYAASESPVILLYLASLYAFCACSGLIPISRAATAGSRPILSTKLACSRFVALGFSVPHWLYKSNLFLSARFLAADSSAICVCASFKGLVKPNGDVPPKSIIGPVVPVPASVPVPTNLPWPNNVFRVGAVPEVPVYVPSVVVLGEVTPDAVVVASVFLPVVVVSVLSVLTLVSVSKSTTPPDVTLLAAVAASAFILSCAALSLAACSSCKRFSIACVSAVLMRGITVYPIFFSYACCHSGVASKPADSANFLTAP